MKILIPFKLLDLLDLNKLRETKKKVASIRFKIELCHFKRFSNNDNIIHQLQCVYGVQKMIKTKLNHKIIP